MEKSKRVLIIGLDGATWDVLDPWIDDGSLPNLARLRRSGSWGTLASTIPPLTAPAWSTFMTGKRPAKHGVYHFIKLFEDGRSNAGEKPELVNGRSLRSPTLWDIAGHYDRKVVAINVPMTYPPRPVNGALITCFLTPKNAPFTYPPELADELDDYIIDLDRFIDTKPYQGSHKEEAIAPSRMLMREFRQMTEKRAETALSLMGSKPWDVFMVVFTSTDRMGHYFWPYHRSPTLKDDPAAQELCRAVHRHYVRLDEIIGELVAQAGPDTTLIIVSDHGMGPDPTQRVHLNNWLQQRGWLTPVKSETQSVPGPDRWLGKLGIPRDKIGRIIRRIPGLMETRFIQNAARSRSLEVDAAHSLAYAVPVFEMIAGIRVNLDGEAKEALCCAISSGLETLTDPQTAERVVERVYRGADYYSGPYATNIPDLIVVMRPEYRSSLELGHYSGVVTEKSAPSAHGNHRMNGVFLANGVRIVANPNPLPNLAIEDVAPTVLHLMGLPVASDMDGHVLTEVLQPAFLDEQPVQYARPVGFWPNGGEVAYQDAPVSEANEELVRQRLAALGYLE